MDFSLTTLFVVPVGQTALPSAGSTQDLTPGQVGFFTSNYQVASSANLNTSQYFYVAQGRENNYLQGSKRSDKIASANYFNYSNIIDYYKVQACPVPLVQISKIGNWHVQCGEDVTVTLRAHSSYLDTLYFNGFTRSVTVAAPCCDCDGGDACTDVNVPNLIDSIIAEFLSQGTDAPNPDNIKFSDFYEFRRDGNDTSATLVITGKPLTKYGVPCDVAAFPHEYDRMWFRAFAYAGPATTADFIVNDACDTVADSYVVQRATYATGTSDEIAQLEKNFYSYQAGYLKHLYRMAGYNQNFESYVSAGTAYDTFYIKFNEYGKGNYNWGDYIPEDSTVIIAVENGSGMSGDIETFLEDAIGNGGDFINDCVTTTSTTTSAPGTTTTTTSTLIP